MENGNTMSRRDAVRAAVLLSSSLGPYEAEAAAKSGWIDAHVHVWTPETVTYPLAEGFKPEQMQPKSFTPEELLKHARPCGVGRIVLIQMSYYRYDNSYMIDTMRRFPGVFSGVGIVNEEAARPQDEMRRFGVSEGQIAGGDASGPWPALMRFQTERARALINAGAPLGRALPGRIGLEIRTIVQGGLRILEKIDKSEGDVYHHRPVLRAYDWPLLLFRAL